MSADFTTIDELRKDHERLQAILDGGPLSIVNESGELIPGRVEIDRALYEWRAANKPAAE